jgi:hypothetical protein
MNWWKWKIRWWRFKCRKWKACRDATWDFDIEKLTCTNKRCPLSSYIPTARVFRKAMEKGGG